MSPTLCFMIYFSISWIMLIYVYLSTIQTILMYLFICKWKHMKIMNDDLIVRLSLICTIGITFWLTYVHKFWSQGKDNKQVSFKTFFVCILQSSDKKMFILDRQNYLICSRIFLPYDLSQVLMEKSSIL